ncbi:MAG: FlgD immunoglobulin-like domain containing protein [bacterium]
MRIWNSRIHDFAETGLWAKKSIGDGLWVEDVVVERGSGLAVSLGDLGVFLDEADHVLLLGSTVDLRGLFAQTPGTGVLAQFSKTFCQSTTSEPRLLSIEGCLLEGPASDQVVAQKGLEAIWLCGADGYRDIEILRNGIYDWAEVGMDFFQSADVQITCNHVIGCDRGVDIYRDSDPTGTSLRFKYNKFEALAADTALFALRTSDAEKVKLGPSNFLRGDNRLDVNQSLTRFIFENDTDSTKVLNATYNYWLGSGALFGNADSIVSRIYSPDSTFDISNFVTPGNEEMIACDSTVPAPDSSAATRRRPAPTRPEDRPTSLDEVRAFSLGTAFPNPNRGGVRLDLRIPADRTGEWSLQVYDVAGRRVLRRVQQIPAPGAYVVEWDGANQDGRSMPGGVYFLQLVGPGGTREVRKTTLLR